MIYVYYVMTGKLVPVSKKRRAATKRPVTKRKAGK